MPNEKNTLQELPLLSVIVPIYNEADCLFDLLAKLIPYCNIRNWKLILVDDGSNDNTSAILEEYERISRRNHPSP